MPQRASARREREYRKLTHQFEEEGRYPGREEEVAARIVNKQRKQFGETKTARERDRQGQSPDRKLPIDDYQHLTVPQVRRQLDGLSAAELKQVRRYESQHKQRKGVLEAIAKMH